MLDQPVILDMLEIVLTMTFAMQPFLYHQKEDAARYLG
jgi:hypothetical protein